jgi:predicted aspartyl protease
MLVGQVALLMSGTGVLCVASSSPIPIEGGEDESTAKAEVPFQLYNDNLIIVKATIGPIKNVNMILDTGTSPTAINQVMADRLNVRGKAGLLQTLNGTIQAQSVRLPRIQIGLLHADSITGVVQDLTFIEHSLGISLGGIAGLDILSTCNFTIDYRRQKIIFGPVSANEKEVHFETQIPFLTVKAKIEGHEVRLLVDSGTWGLLVYRNRLQTVPKELHVDPKASISTAGGTTQVKWLSAEVALGKRNLGARNVAIADIDSDPQYDFDGLLGFAKMGFRKVSFDFENGPSVGSDQKIGQFRQETAPTRRISTEMSASAYKSIHLDVNRLRRFDSYTARGNQSKFKLTRWRLYRQVAFCLQMAHWRFITRPESYRENVSMMSASRRRTRQTK